MLQSYCISDLQLKVRDVSYLNQVLWSESISVSEKSAWIWH